MTATQTLERTNVGDLHDVILTAGCSLRRGDGTFGPIFGLFAAEEDARSAEADSLALGTCGPEALTACQIALAHRNSERINA